MSEIDQAIVKQVSDENGIYVAFLAAAQAFRITDDASFAEASARAQIAHVRHAEVEAKRTSITKPILEGKRRVDELFRAPLSALVSIKATYTTKIGEYTLAQRKAQAEAMQASAEAFQAGGTPTEAIPEVPQAKEVNIKARWLPQIANADLVPREYCSPDVAKLKAAIRYADTEHTPPRPIPGVDFVLDAAVTVRR